MIIHVYSFSFASKMIYAKVNAYQTNIYMVYAFKLMHH